MHLASLFLYIKFLQINSLEVVVNTESDIITVKRCTPNVICLSTTYVILSRLPSNETNVSYEAYLWAEVNCETWSQTCFPFINRCCMWTLMCVIIMSIAKTTIYESIYILRTYKCVTCVWCKFEIVTRLSLILNRVTFTPTNYCTD